MSEEAQGVSPELVTLAADIVCAYVSNNSVPVAELSTLLGSVHAALNVLAAGPSQTAHAEDVEKPTPAQVRKSITPDALISFLDGKPYKTLKRHLTGHGLDPHSYRQRYGLSSDYPMVASNYAAQRSALAKQIGLGRAGAQASSDDPKPRGRRKAA
ncbi:MucR family transcriptional regulator [Methylobacterium soli]|uniref:MucR family transcriptional regulator n=1 Tax=Methylobacterium soli TaxID=553447 RepID=A0A6L3T4S5_9HYPH|nr:MucR family transcriptional regulator [Methylobacterium soli]KAB1081898.1 MucR family transcriptional regulator [Methylobacterium soli]GJE42682.1 Transcriptional regulatory protein ros [Methylobacterium soli]